MEGSSFLSAEEARVIADRFGTPVYVYREDRLRAAAREVLAMPNAYGFQGRFAMKACPNRAVLRLFESMGLHFDASSGWEVKRMIRAGIAPEKISLSTQELPEDFADLVAQGIKVNACSLRQLERYGKAFPGKEVGIRLNCGEGSGHNNRTNTGGVSSSFGIWWDFADRIKAIAQAHDLHIIRIHTHIGSGGDPTLWQRTAELSLKLVPEFPEVHTVNLGGGFKVARMPGEKQAELQSIGESVKQTFEKLAADTGRKLKLEIEPGTFLVARAGAVLAKVTDIVSTGDEGYQFLKVDSGMTEILRPSMYGARHQLRVFPQNETGKTLPYLVAGHCCESGDILTPAQGEPEMLEPRELPEAAVGDLFLIEDAGAYCSSMAATNYNSFPAAPEVLLQEDGEPRLVRKRQTLEQSLENEVD